MQILSRRSLLAGGALLPFSALLGRTAMAQVGPARVRYDARSKQGQQMLALYALGVKNMKAAQDSDPTSWLFQWYTHWVKGPGRPRTAVVAAKNAELNRIFPKGGTNRDLANAMWDTCQAHGMGVFPIEDENYFLPWHRIYVYFLERIVRKWCKDDSFTLPYWNYSTTDMKIRGVIPPEFTKASDPTYASLFVKNRNPGINTGTPLQNEPVFAGQPGDPLSLDALTQATYEPSFPEAGFCQQLDGGLHGNVHVGVGTSTNMGSVPFAANDPIFWMHHCNIDRLWASWNAGGGQNPSDLNQTFTFADEHGKSVTKNVNEVMDIATLGYKYDRLEPIPGARRAPAEMLAASRSRRRRAATGPITLGATPVSSPLVLQADAANAAPQGLSAIAANIAPSRKIYLVVRGIQAEASPGVLYYIYLDLPPKATDEQKKEHLAGVVNFFHAIHGDMENMAATKADHVDPKERFVSFDITPVAKRLGSKELLREKPTVTIVPSAPPESGSNPVIREISLVEA